jgi:DNA (cytosine-5)-methyltransferase 1
MLKPAMSGDGVAVNSKYGVKLVRGPFLRLPPHPEAVDTADELQELATGLPGPLAADLFCGAGGLSLGLAEAGYTVVLGVDHDDDALETHRALHPGLSVNWDLADKAVVERVGALLLELEVDLIAGGPPCQPFSRAGRSAMRDLVRRGERLGKDLRRELWQSFLRIVSIARPPAVLMENVPDMALDRDMWILRTMVDELEALGYAVEERVVATAEYGVPQHRQRLILVALSDRVRFRWPERVAERISVRNAIGELPTVAGGWRPENGDDERDPVASGWIAYPGAQTGFQRAMRAGVPVDQAERLYDHITRPVRLDDLQAFEQMDHSTRYSDLAPELRRYRHDIFDDKYKRLDWNGLSRTITAHIAKDGYWYIHPEQHRTLTVREAARLQTFPDHIRFAGPPSAAFRQIGNAVPPLLARHLGNAIRSSQEAGETEDLSTADVASVLAEWFRGRGVLTLPWLRAATRWQVIQFEILWGRVARDHVRRAWSMTERLTTPALTLAPTSRNLLKRYASGLGRTDRFVNLVEAAEWCEGHPDVLAPDTPFSRLADAPYVGPAVADLAVRVVPGPGEDRDEPVLITYGSLRVAARFLGEDVEENQNRLSDGRLAVARMIGGEDHSHEAHLGLIELAASTCTPNAPDCGNCPLAFACHHAATNGYQLSLSPVPARSA